MKIIKTKVKTFNGVVNTVFSDDKISKESIHCTCISAININLVMKIDKKNYPQIYLEQFKYERKNKTMVKLIDAELDLNHSDVSSDSKFFCLVNNLIDYLMIKNDFKKLKPLKVKIKANLN